MRRTCGTRSPRGPAGGRLPGRRARAAARRSGCSTWAAGRAATPTNWPGAAWSCTASTSASGSSTGHASGARRRDVRAARCPRPGRSTREFDVVICLCQGAFGLMTANGDDERVLAGMARALRPGGRLALSAFNAYFAVKYFDGDGEGRHVRCRHRREPRAHRGAQRDRRVPRGRPVDRAATRPASCACCAARPASTSTSISSVEPGAYGTATPTMETAEFLVIAHRA